MSRYPSPALAAALKAAQDCTGNVSDSLEAAARVLRQAGYASHGEEWLSVTEPIALHRSNAQIRYLNLGDTYAATILYVAQGDEEPAGFRIGSWGDWLEKAEAAHEAATATYRCAYCGEFHANDGSDLEIRDKSCLEHEPESATAARAARDLAARAEDPPIGDEEARAAWQAREDEKAPYARETVTPAEFGAGVR